MKKRFYYPALDGDYWSTNPLPQAIDIIRGVDKVQPDEDGGVLVADSHESALELFRELNRDDFERDGMPLDGCLVACIPVVLDDDKVKKVNMFDVDDYRIEGIYSYDGAIQDKDIYHEGNLTDIALYHVNI